MPRATSKTAKKKTNSKKALAPKERSPDYFKKLLKEGKLLSCVKLQGDEVHLHFRSPYDKEMYLNSIMRTLQDVYDGCEEFQNQFTFPDKNATEKQSPLILHLKSKQHYRSAKEVKKALAFFAKLQPKWAFAPKLRSGEALSSVTVNPDGNVILHLQPFYDKSIYYLKINKALRSLHKCSPSFKEYFKMPKESNSAPVLKLKNRDVCFNNQTVLEMLIQASKETIKNASPEKSPAIHHSHEEWLGEIELPDVATETDNISSQEPHFLMTSSELLDLFQENESENIHTQEESFLMRSATLLTLYHKERDQINTTPEAEAIQPANIKNNENQEVQFLINSAELLELFKADISDNELTLSL